MTRRWTVGELARASGLTVRALHHYDRIGLIRPSERTPAGHRRYTDADVRHLYQVRALHQLGFALDEIATVLAAADDADGLRDLLVAQLRHIEARERSLAECRRRIQALLDRVDGPDGPEPGQFLAVLETTIPLINADAYLTPRQRAALARRGRELGIENVEALRAEWLDLVDHLRKLRRDAVPADDPRVRALADRWHEIGTALRGATMSDPQLNERLSTVWRDNRHQIDAGLAQRVPSLEPGDLVAIVEYVEQARGADRP